MIRKASLVVILARSRRTSQARRLSILGSSKERCGRVEERIGAIEQKLSEHERRFDHTEMRLDDLPSKRQLLWSSIGFALTLFVSILAIGQHMSGVMSTALSAVQTAVSVRSSEAPQSQQPVVVVVPTPGAKPVEPADPIPQVSQPSH